jgi:hypothetical protein
MWFPFNANRRRPHPNPNLDLDPPPTTTERVSNVSAPKTAAFTEQLTLPTEMSGEAESHETFLASLIVNKEKEKNPERFLLPSRFIAREDDHDIDTTPESGLDEG